MVKDTLMFSKTYRNDDDWTADPAEVKHHRGKKKRRIPPSHKELLDALEEHGDGYIPDETDWLDRGE